MLKVSNYNRADIGSHGTHADNGTIWDSTCIRKVHIDRHPRRARCRKDSRIVEARDELHPLSLGPLPTPQEAGIDSVFDFALNGTAKPLYDVPQWPLPFWNTGALCL